MPGEILTSLHGREIGLDADGNLILNKLNGRRVVIEDGFSEAEAAAVRGLVLADGIGATPQDRLIRATEGGLILLPRAHPRYHCHYFAGNYFSDANALPDITALQNHAVFQSSLNSATAGANAGYVTTAASSNAMWEVPDPNFDYVAGESLLLVWLLKHTVNTASNLTILGNGIAGSAPGVRITSVASGGVGTTYSVGLFNQAGVVATGTSSITGANDNALSNTLKSVAVLFNGSNQKWSGWLNGAVIRNELSFTLAGSTASASRWYVGGGQGNTTGALAIQTRMLAVFKWPAGSPPPAVASITLAIARLVANPQRLLLDGEL